MLRREKEFTLARKLRKLSELGEILREMAKLSIILCDILNQNLKAQHMTKPGHDISL